jgi:release factor glutamine methyltransferase
MTAGVTTAGGALATVRRRLAEAGIDQPGLEARLLLADAIGCDIAILIGHPERALSAEEAARLEDRLRRRLRREPLAYILGRREFWSLSLAVNSHTLIPRPETETLVEAALAWAGGRRGLRIIDLGTGSGCLLLALLSELPDAWGVGVDVSEGALAVATANARDLGLGDRAAFVRADWADSVAGAFDLIVSNPPYVSDGEWRDLDPGVRDFEPARALRAGDDGLAAYRRILPALPGLFAAGGRAFVEIGGAGAARLPELVAASQLQIIEISPDLGHRRRCLEIAAGAVGPRKNFLGNQMVPV